MNIKFLINLIILILFTKLFLPNSNYINIFFVLILMGVIYLHENKIEKFSPNDGNYLLLNNEQKNMNIKDDKNLVNTLKYSNYLINNNKIDFENLTYNELLFKINNKEIKNLVIKENGKIFDEFDNFIGEYLEFLNYPNNSKIDQHGNIYNYNNDKIGDIKSNLNNLDYIYELSLSGYFNNSTIDSEGNILDINGNIIYKLNSLKKYSSGSKINKHGFILNSNNEIIGHIGGENYSKKLINYLTKNNLIKDYTILKDGTILDNFGEKIGKVNELKGNNIRKFNKYGLITNQENEIINNTFNDNEINDNFIELSQNGILDKMIIKNNNLLDEKGNVISKLTSLDNYPNGSYIISF